MKKIVLGILRYIPFLTLLVSVTLTIAGCSTDEINKGMYEELSKLQTKGMNRTAEHECRHVPQGEAEICMSRYKKIYEDEYYKR